MFLNFTLPYSCPTTASCFTLCVIRFLKHLPVDFLFPTFHLRALWERKLHFIYYIFPRSSVILLLYFCVLMVNTYHAGRWFTWYHPCCVGMRTWVWSLRSYIKNKAAWWYILAPQCWGHRTRQLSATHWFASLGYCACPKSQRETVSIKHVRWPLRNDTWGCSLASTLVHIHVHIEAHPPPYGGPYMHQIK